jgi:seryl-tRNA synthetase
MGRKKKIDNVELKFEQYNLINEVPMTETATEVPIKLEELEIEVDRVRVELEQAKKELAEKKEEIARLPKRELDESEKKMDKKLESLRGASAGLKDKIEKQKEYDNQKVTGKFMNRRHPGSSVKLTYMKYEDDPVKWWDLEDGKVYTIPRGFADQINEYYYKPHMIQKSPDQFMDPNRPSSAIAEVDTSNKLYGFVPINF